MTMSARRTLLAFALLIGLVVAAPALATEESPTKTETDTPIVDAPEPAVEIPAAAPDDEAAEWSYRFLVPATMVLGTLAVVGTIFMYFVRVTKNRYRVVD